MQKADVHHTDASSTWWSGSCVIYNVDVYLKTWISVEGLSQRDVVNGCKMCVQKDGLKIRNG